MTRPPDALAPSDQEEWCAQELAALCSPYLSTGYRGEEVRLTSLRRAEERLVADYAVAGGAVDSFGVFHLSSLSAFLMMSQLAVVGVHIDQGLRRKTGEVFVHDVSLRCRRQVNSSQVTCSLAILHRRLTGRGMYYKVSYAIESGAFVATASVMHIDTPLADG